MTTVPTYMIIVRSQLIFPDPWEIIVLIRGNSAIRVFLRIGLYIHVLKVLSYMFYHSLCPLCILSQHNTIYVALLLMTVCEVCILGFVVMNCISPYPDVPVKFLFSASKGGASNDLRSACNRLYGGRGQVPPYQSPQMKRGDNFRSSRGQQGPNVVQNNVSAFPFPLYQKQYFPSIYYLSISAFY